jgi:hypothetical protein
MRSSRSRHSHSLLKQQAEDFKLGPSQGQGKMGLKTAPFLLINREKPEMGVEKSLA